MATVTVNETNFEIEVLKSDIPVLVDFWAEWCGPCKAISPYLEEISQEMTGKIKIAKINIDDNSDLATQYGVRSIPTLLIFKNGAVSSTQVGSLAKNKIVGWINDNI